MKIRATAVMRTVLAAAFLWAAPTVHATATDPALTPEETEQLQGLIEESRAMYLGLLAGVSDAQWGFKPAEDRWSVGECAEHIVRSNEALLAAAKQAMSGEPTDDWETKTQGKTALLLQVMPNRNPGGAGGATAPQEIRPTGELSRQEIVDRFEELYVELTQMASTSDPYKSHTQEHPFPIFGTLSAYDWIIYVPLHTIRHSKQMIEVMETEGYPAK